MAIIFTENFDIPLMGTWSTDRWNLVAVSGTSSTNASSQGVLTLPATTNTYIYAQPKMPTASAQDVTFMVNRPSTSAILSAGIMASGAVSSDSSQGMWQHNGFFMFAANNTFNFSKRVNGVRTLLGSMSTTAGTNYNVRMRYENTTRRFAWKMWATSAAEPAAWNYDAVQPEETPAGGALFSLRANTTAASRTVIFDSISVDDIGGTSVVGTAAPMTASAQSFKPVLFVEKHNVFTTTPATASTTSPTPVVRIHKVFTTSPGTASGLSVAPSVRGTARYTAPVATATAMAPLAKASGSALVNAPGMVATAGVIHPPTITANSVHRVAAATATAAMPTAKASATNRAATVWDEYATGRVPIDWAVRVGSSLLTVESIAGTLAGRALRSPGNVVGQSLYTWDKIAPAQTGEILIRVLGQGFGPAIHFGDTFIQANRFGTQVEFFDQNGYGNYYEAGLNSGWTYIRLRLNTDSVQVKAWPEGVVEPTNWLATHSLTHVAGRFGVFAYTNRFAYADYFSAANHGMEATQYSTGKEIDAAPFRATANSINAVVGTGNTQAVLPALATSESITPTITTTVGVFVRPAPMTATADAGPLSYAYTPDVTNYQKSWRATATLPEPTVRAATDIRFGAGVVEASAEMTEPTFSNVTEVQATATPMRAAARLPYYTEEDDRFLELIRTAFANIGDSSANAWFRFGQRSFGPLKNYAQNSNISQGTWEGEPEFNITDDYSRPATRFDADTFTLLEYDNFARRTQLTWEIVFRTTTDGPLISAESGASVSGLIVSGLSVHQGRLFVHDLGRAAGPAVNDGNWHHVMVTVGDRGTEVFVDGVSRLIRRPGSGPTIALPAERIGAFVTGSGQTFTGDILMFAQYGRQLPREAGNRHYYAYVYATVVGATAAKATAALARAKGKGNQLRALGLYFDGGADYDGLNNTNASGIRMGFPSNMNQGIRFDTSPFLLGPYLVFPQSINASAAGEGWRDDYDFAPRYIDLSTDIETITDYDMVFFIDVPPRNRVYDDSLVTGREYNMADAFDRMVGSVRWAVDQGLSAWVPQPEVAEAMGIIDGLDVHSLEKEFTGDLKSWREDDPAWRTSNSNAVSNYRDTHYNNKYRITAQLDGLTDLGGYLLDDVVYWYNDNNPFSARPDYLKWNVKDVTGGLKLNDTLYFPTDLFWVGQTSTRPAEYLRPFVISVPEGKYVGTAVAKEQGTINMRGDEVPNPYSDNALAIVLRPGDVLNGRPLGGKILVDFMSGYAGGQQLTELPTIFRQVGPFDNGSVKNGLLFDGYSYDSRRQASFFSFLSYAYITQTKSGDTLSRDVQLPSFSAFERFPVQTLPQYPMLARELNWLGIKEEVPEGSVRQFTTAQKATATLPEPTVRVERQNVVKAQPAVALARIVKPANVIEPDVEIVELPMTAAAQLVGPPTLIKAGAMEAHAAFVDNAQTVGQGQDFIVFLNTMDVTLYLKEDTA